jgi:tetratricopeptide (TPR) repeat protein
MQSNELVSRLNAALDKRRVGDFPSALKEFEALERLSEHPQDIAALRFFQVTCLTDMGKSEEAFKRIQQVDESKLMSSNQIDCQFERARIERALGRRSEAIAQILKALDTASRVDDPQEIAVVHSNLRTLHGILLAESGRYDEAVPVLEDVPTEDEGWAEAQIHLGDCKYKMKLYREAIGCYMSVISASKTAHTIYVDTAMRNIGFAHYELREYTMAVECLSKVVNAYEDEPEMKAELFSILASSYSRLGRTEEAANYSGYSKGSGNVQ